MPGVTLDIPAMSLAIADYINGLSFTPTLTASEILGVLYRYGIRQVDTSNDPVVGFQLKGMVRDSVGTVHTLAGHALDLQCITDTGYMLLPSTCVFGANVADIAITVGV